MDTTNNINKSIKSTIKVTNGCGEYQLPDWGDKVKFIDAEEDEKTGGVKNSYQINMTAQEAIQYIQEILLPNLREVIENMGADDDHYDYVPAYIEEILEFIGKLPYEEVCYSEYLQNILDMGDAYDYDLGEGSEYLNIEAYWDTLPNQD